MKNAIINGKSNESRTLELMRKGAKKIYGKKLKELQLKADNKEIGTDQIS